MTFIHADAKEPLPGPFDLACFFDCLHDLGHPVEAARRARESLAEDGTLMLVEPYAADKVEDNLNPVGRITIRARPGSAARMRSSEAGTHVLGAQAGEARLAQVSPRGGLRPCAPGSANAVQPDPRSAAVTAASTTPKSCAPP